MTELIKTNTNLPDKIEDLAKFILFNRERIISVRAEIRAMEKLKIVQEIREQKLEEASMLAEVLLDAEIRIGELFRKIPTNQGKRTDLEHTDIDVGKSKSKKEIISDLGFSVKQGERLEKLADYKNIVEFVKVEARENGGFPTRARVLKLADYEKRQKNECDEYDNFIDTGVKAYKEMMKIIDLVGKYDMSDYRMDALRENFGGIINVENHVEWIETAKAKLTMIEVELRKPKKHKFNFRGYLCKN